MAVIEPFYFGPGARKLFGIFHPANQDAARSLVVICPPLFTEYNRTHFLLRELACALADHGHDVLRFDYRGTADSYGELRSTTVAGWCEDIQMAVREGRDLSSSPRTQLLAVRAGALLACRALSCKTAVQNLVLWDPVPSGAQYLDELRQQQMQIINRIPLTPEERVLAIEEYAGQRLSQEMIRELQELNTPDRTAIRAERIQQLLTRELALPLSSDTTTKIVPCAVDWTSDAEDQVFLRVLLEHLVSCLDH
jgi:alpha/beta superfamily hydrolase